MPNALGPLILVIEDDPAAAEALTLVLRDWGAEVVHGLSYDALRAKLGARLAQTRWIITDFDLGDGSDGITLARRLSGSAPDARVLVLSGSTKGRAAGAAAQAGFEMMPKPAKANAIVAWLERN